MPDARVPRRLLALCNGAASGARNADVEGALGCLRDAGFCIDLHYTRSAAQARSLIRDQAANADAVLLGGGDGTVNQVLPALLDVDAPLGLLPLGTGNDFARTLELPLDLQDAARAVVSGRVRTIDVGWANERPFLNAAGIGISGTLARELSQNAKSRLGVLSYPAAVLKALYRQRPFTVTLRTGDDEGITLDAVQVTIANGVYYGGGTPIGDDAAIDDARMDAVCVQAAPLWRLLGAALAVKRGRADSGPNAVTHLRSDSFELHTRPSMIVTLDGEPVLRSPVRFRVTPKRLRVFVPKDRASEAPAVDLPPARSA